MAGLGSEAVDERRAQRRAAPPRELRSDLPSKASLSPGLAGIPLGSGQITELYVVFVAVSGASTRFPSRSHYSGERQAVGKKMTQKSR